VMTAPGDSGGPSFLGGRIAGVTSNGNLQQQGFYAQGSNAFGSTANFTRVSAFASWIDQTIGGPFALVLDMTRQPAGGDGVADTIAVSRSGADLQVFINGQFVQAVPFAKVTSVSILGSTDVEQITVDLGFALPVTVDGGSGGGNTLVVQGTAFTDHIQVTATQVDRIADSPVSYSNIQNLEVNTLDGPDTVNVSGVPSFSLKVNTGAGSDTIFLANSSVKFVTVDGGTEADTLEISTSGTH